METIYLDQNKWIQLARIYHGKDSEPSSQEFLQKFLWLTESGAVCFPLSSVHYMETTRNRNHEQRKKTGELMWALSKGVTLASYTDIVEFEIRNALSKWPATTILAHSDN